MKVGDRGVGGAVLVALPPQFSASHSAALWHLPAGGYRWVRQKLYGTVEDAVAAVLAHAVPGKYRVQSSCDGPPAPDAEAHLIHTGRG